MAKRSDTKTFHVRITNEYGEGRHEAITVYSIRFVQKEGENIIRVQNLVRKGIYKSLLLGLSLNGLCQWLNSPEQDTYREIYDDTEHKWCQSMTVPRLLDLHFFGDDNDGA